MARTLDSRRNGIGAPDEPMLMMEPGMAGAIAPVLSFRPKPSDTLVGRTHNLAGHSTAIGRGWRSMDEVGRCHLCPLADCQARRDGLPRCLVVVPEYVRDADAPLFSLVEWRARHGFGVRAEVDAPPAAAD